MLLIFLRKEKKEHQKGAVFFINKGLKCTVGTPFHNADKGQKRYLRKRQKNGPNFSFLTPFWAPITVTKKGKKLRTQKRYKKVLRILWLVGLFLRQKAKLPQFRIVIEFQPSPSQRPTKRSNYARNDENEVTALLFFCSFDEFITKTDIYRRSIFLFSEGIKATFYLVLTSCFFPVI